jgi:hypothetical protein
LHDTHPDLSSLDLRDRNKPVQAPSLSFTVDGKANLPYRVGELAVLVAVGWKFSVWEATANRHVVLMETPCAMSGLSNA